MMDTSVMNGNYDENGESKHDSSSSRRRSTSSSGDMRSANDDVSYAQSSSSSSSSKISGSSNNRHTRRCRPTPAQAAAYRGPDGLRPRGSARGGTSTRSQT